MFFQKCRNIFLKYKEIILYIIFGVLTTVVNFVVYTPLTNLLGAEFFVLGIPWYLYTTVIAWIAAVLFAFFTNKLFVFEQKSFQGRILAREMISFAGARVATLLIEMFIMWLLITVIHADRWGIIQWAAGLFGQGGDWIIKAGAEVIVIILNYVLSKLVVFRKAKPEQEKQV